MSEHALTSPVPLTKTLVIGATGLTGQALVNHLLEDSHAKEIHLFVRRKLDIAHEKLSQHVIDFDNLAVFEHLFANSTVFCCLGTTIKHAGSRENFYWVDVELVTQCAKLAVTAKSLQLVVISAIGANSRSLLFYNQCKGVMEENIVKLCKNSETQLIICRPSLLLGSRKQPRYLEQSLSFISRWLPFLFKGWFKRWKPIQATLLAKAMIRLVKQLKNDKISVVENNDLHRLSNS
ncbi:NAD(P)H-binding protein [Thalassotalea ganghwensis]